MKSIVIAISAALVFAQGAIAADKIVTCEITSNNERVYKGKCVFIPDQGGSFALSGMQGKPLYDSITIVSVTLLEKGIADVRGLTTDGVNSRWGDAKRSTKDKSCWVGSDFKICAK